MNALHSKAQRQIGESSSKAKSKGSARKARSKKKKASSKSQNAGQPSGPGGSVSTSQRSRSRHAVSPTEETRATSSRGSEGPGMGSKVASYMVGAIHTVDIGLGLALLVYGGMVHVVSVTAAMVCYGLVMMLGSIAGAVGYYSDSFNRRGLFGSAIAGVILCLLDICLFFAVFAGWDTFITFLKDNHDALMLNDGSINTINGLRYLYALIFIVLAGLEGHRAMVMWGMRDTMQGTSSARSTSSSKGCCDGLLSMFGLSKRKKTDDFVVFDDNASLESALLWSKNGAQPTSEDYLEFVPEHERGLADFTASVGLPEPPEDRVDY